MLETLGSKNRLRIISALTSVLIGIGFFSKEVAAFDPKEIKFNSHPFEASQILKRNSGPSGDKYESFIFSIKYKGNWYSVGAKGAAQVVPNSIANKAINELEKKLKLDNLMSELDHIEYMVTIHNHGAEVLYEHINFFGLQKSDIKDKGKLLSGPSNGYGDCPTSFVSIIVEPGGSWLCKEVDSALNTIENGTKLIALRRELILASQQLSGEDLKKAIAEFVANARSQVGLEIVFVPNGTSRNDFELLIDRFSKINK